MPSSQDPENFHISCCRIFTLRDSIASWFNFRDSILPDKSRLAAILDSHRTGHEILRKSPRLPSGCPCRGYDDPDTVGNAVSVPNASCFCLWLDEARRVSETLVILDLS